MILLASFALAAPIWLLCQVIGIFLMFFAKHRHLSLHFNIAPTLAFIVGQILSIATLTFISRVLGIHGHSGQETLTWGYFSGFAVGGAMGVVAGLS